jgi:Secretion system C-terminal sorting domain
VLENNTEYLVTTMPSNGNASQKVKGNRVVIDGLIPQTNYSIIVSSLSNPLLTQTISVQTLEQTNGIIEELITYQNRQSIIRDSALYYQCIDSLSPKQALQILSQMQKDGVMLDSAWFHEGGLIRLEGVPLPTTEDAIENVRSSFTVKLKESSLLMKKYNFIKGIASWRYSDYFNSTQSQTFRLHPYRYRFYTFTNVMLNVEHQQNGFHLQILPNPIESESKISYFLPVATFVSLELFDTKGRIVRSLLQNQIQIGEQTIQIRRDELPIGIYFLRLRQGMYNGQNTSRIVQVQFY